MPIRLLHRVSGVRRVRPGSASEALAGYIRRKYQGAADRRGDGDRRPGPAIRTGLQDRAVSRRGDRVFRRRRPGIERPTAPAVSRANCAAPPTSKHSQLALKLHPSTEQVFVIANGRDARNVEAVHAALDASSWPVRLTYLDEPSVSGLIAAVAALPPRSLVLYVWYTERDRGFAAETPRRLRAWWRRPRPCPFTVRMSATSDQAWLAAWCAARREPEFAWQKWRGRSSPAGEPRTFRSKTPRLVPIVDWRQVQRWRINPSRLPDGSDIRFKVPTRVGILSGSSSSPSSWSSRRNWC